MPINNPDQQQVEVVQKPAENRLVILDTNCFVKLYHSPVLPFLGQLAGGYNLMTLTCLIDEFKRSDRLQSEYAWLNRKVAAEDLDKIAIKLSADQIVAVAESIEIDCAYSRDWLSEYCNNHAVKVKRTLSDPDSELLATAIVLKAIIATDEWPLQRVIDDLMSVEGEYEIGVITSVHILKALEQGQYLSRETRIATVKAWVQFNEPLPHNWKAIYKQLFDESAP